MFTVRRWPRRIGFAALAAALSASAAGAQEAAPALTSVRAVEIERAQDVERVLVLASGDLSPRLEVVSEEIVVLDLPGAQLDPKAPRQVVPGPGSVIRSVRLSETGPPAAVEIRIRREAGRPARLSRRGSIVAVELQRPQAPGVASVTLRINDRPIVELVQAVQRITHGTFVWDDRLQGSVTVIIQDPVTEGEALEILHATLFSKGFAAVPGAEGSLVILPLDEARARAPRVRRALSRERAALITALARFRSVNAEELVNLLGAFSGATLNAIAYAPTNGVILVGPEAAIHRWLGLARSIDELQGRELAVIRPQYRSAGELYPLLSEILVDPLTGRSRAALLLDARTNALIVQAEPGALARVRAQVAELDTPPEPSGDVLVVRPRFADPERLARQLEGLAAGSGAGAGVLGAQHASSLGPFTVALHAAGGTLLISADLGTQRALRSVIEELDVEPASIRVDVQVLEIATTGALAFGVDAFIPSTDPSNPGRSIFGVGVNDPFDLVPDPIQSTFLARYARTPVVVPIIGPGGVPVNVTLPRDIVQVKAAEGEARVRTLMRPQLMALSGEEHEFTSGLNVPIPVTTATSAAGNLADPLSTRVDVERQDVGIRLRLKPVAAEGGDVRIAVDLDVTAVRPPREPSRDDVGPELARRTLQAHTRVDDGGAAVLGMTLERRSLGAETGAPGLREVPILGNLLEQTADLSEDRTLVITLQAHIQRSADERLADTIRVRTAHERSLARTGSFRVDGSSWALLVATRTSHSDAEALAAQLGEIAGRRPRVSGWTWDGAERFDVLYSGFAHAREAAAALEALEAAGESAELLAVPSGRSY